MDNLRREPTKFQQGLGVFFSAILMLTFAVISALLWSTGKSELYVPATICTALLLGSAILFSRATFTSSRALTDKESNALAWALIVLGLCGSIVALLLHQGFSGGRHGLLGGSLFCLANGLVYKRRHR